MCINTNKATYIFLADIDECAEGSHSCDSNADCTNTVGSHNCNVESATMGLEIPAVRSQLHVVLLCISCATINIAIIIM